MEKEDSFNLHDVSIRGGFLNSELREYHQHVSRKGKGLPKPGQRIVTQRGPFLVEDVEDLGLDEKGNWGFDVRGELV